MTKKTYIALADQMRQLKPVSCQINGQSPFGSGVDTGAMRQWKTTIDNLADWLEHNNPAFKRQRWIGYINGDNGPNGGRP